MQSDIRISVKENLQIPMLTNGVTSTKTDEGKSRRKVVLNTNAGIDVKRNSRRIEIGEIIKNNFKKVLTFLQMCDSMTI